MLRQIIKFGIVGICNTAIDLAVLNLLIFLTGLGASGGLYFILYKTFGFLAATTNSYFINKFWTFGDKANHQILKIGQFLAVSVVALILNVAIADGVVGFLNNTGKLAPTIAALIATAIGLIWNFIGYKFLVFKGEPTQEASEILPPV